MKLDYLMTGVVSGEYLEVSGMGDILQDSGMVNLGLTVCSAPQESLF